MNKKEHLRLISRLHKLDQMIRTGRCLSAEQAARELEVHPRTIMRDLDLLRDRMELPLQYNSQTRRWEYTEKVHGLTTVHLTEGELISIFIAEKVLNQLSGTKFEEKLKKAFEKILSSLTDSVTIDWNELGELYSFDAGPIAPADIKTFDAIAKATRNKKSLEITYFTQSRGTLTKRTIDPYHLHNYKGDWYVIAFNHMRKEVRAFHINRIKAIQPRKSFIVQDGFDLKRYLASGFSMYRGGKTYTVEIEFDKYQARWIREKHKWHSTETRKNLSDGRTIIQFQVESLEPVMRFVLQYGSHAKVHKPAELKDMIKKEMRLIAENYTS
jgi:predicted DNA-binding transcriptional regulator YafY